jgi:chromosome segregation ATPase
MEVQERHGEATAAALEGIAGNMTRLSEAADRQTETLTGIAGQLRTGNDQTRRWAEFFAELPALAEAQRGTLATLSEQVAAGRQAEAKIGESLESVRGALQTLDRSQTTSTQALWRLEESSGQNQKLVGELIRKQRTWLARLVVVTLCVALAAVALAVIALVR